MSDSSILNRTTIISTKILTPTDIDNHYFMICIYLSYMHQLQQAIYFILITLGQSPGHPVQDFGYFYMLFIYFMYWMRLFQLYFQRLSIVNPKKAQMLVSKISLWLQLSKSTTNSRDNSLLEDIENNHLD